MRRLFPTIMTIGIAAAVLLFAGTGCDDKKVADPVAMPDTPRAEGEKAFKAGVPANANPYTGANNYVTSSRRWLDGWIEAKEKSEAKK